MASFSFVLLRSETTRSFLLLRACTRVMKSIRSRDGVGRDAREAAAEELVAREVDDDVGQLLAQVGRVLVVAEQDLAAVGELALQVVERGLGLGQVGRQVVRVLGALLAVGALLLGVHRRRRRRGPRRLRARGRR